MRLKCSFLIAMMLVPLCASMAAITNDPPQGSISTPSSPAESIYRSNDLWLEITGLTNTVTNTIATFTVHPPSTNLNGAYGLYFNTSLSAPLNWTWLGRSTGSQNLVISNLPLETMFFRLGPPTAMRPGFDEHSLDSNDDGFTDLVPIGFAINFYGTIETNFYINNNGNVTFGNCMTEFIPDSLLDKAIKDSVGIIAPFWADVVTWCADTPPLTYGCGTVDERPSFGVNWIDVGYYLDGSDKLNTFQLVLVDRSERAEGDYDIEFNYAKVEWETGDASHGNGGLGGYPARVGLASVNGSTYEMAGSGVSGWFLDKNPTTGDINPTGLIYGKYNSSVPGRYVIQFHNGTPLGTP